MEFQCPSKLWKSEYVSIQNISWKMDIRIWRSRYEFGYIFQVFHTELYQTSRNYRMAIGLLFRVGQTQDPLVKELITGYSKNKTASPIQVDLRYLVPSNVIDDYWFYLGSATIPSCNDGKLHWVVLRKVHSVTS